MSATREWTQDEIDEDMFRDDEDDAEAQAYEACGRWDQNAPGGLSPYCRLAGTEWCDWDCPLSRPHRETPHD